MSRIWSIALLTLRAAIRSRFLLVFLILLVLIVGALPLMIQHDGTAKMLTQVMLTYSLAVLSAMLGGATLWLACGALAREIGECQMQLVVTKPIARWQVWLGKWLGIALINVLILTVAGVVIHSLVRWHGRSLNPDQQAILQKEVLVARAVLREPPTDRAPEIERIFQQRMQAEGGRNLDPKLVRQAVVEQVQKWDELTPPFRMRVWEIPLGRYARVAPGHHMHLRVKFQSSDAAYEKPDYEVHWFVGRRETGRIWQKRVYMSHDKFREIEVPANLVDAKGILRIEAHNYNQATLRFPLNEGLELLVHDGGFGPNLARGMGVLLFWLLLLAALGLAASGIMTFPVATFFTLTMLIVASSSGLVTDIVREGTVGGLDHETGDAADLILDPVLVPLFRVLGGILSLAQGVSPIERLSTGRSLLWEEVGALFFRVVVLLGGCVAAAGIAAFNRRELALHQAGDS